MKKYLLLFLAIAVATFASAQTEEKNNSDTMKVGNFVIIKNKDKEQKLSVDDSTKNKKSITISLGLGNPIIKYDNGKPKRKSSVSTNWWILDIGFANLRDRTSYGSVETNNYLKATRPGEPNFTANDMKLKTSKSSNVNLWIFMQKLNIAKGYVNLKYGLGLEMYNFRYERNISYLNNPQPFVFRDSVNFSKNKLYAGYATVPLMINFNTNPEKKKGLSVSVGLSAGYLISSRNKQVSYERGKRKINGDFDLEKFRLAYIGELGIGPVRLFGSYSINKLHEKGLTQYPYSIGIRFSNW